MGGKIVYVAHKIKYIQGRKMINIHQLLEKLVPEVSTKSSHKKKERFS